MCEVILRFDGGVFVVFNEEKRRNETEEEKVESEDDETEGLDLVWLVVLQREN